MKTALITGANKGIGLAAARQLAGRGFHVFLSARNVESGRRAAHTLAAEGRKVAFLPLDVTSQESAAAAARELAATAGHLDALVNNAGILFEKDSGILHLEAELLRATFETNTFGPLRVTQAFLPLLEKSSAPRVINVSSGGGQLDGGADGWAPAYCISKTALNGVTVQLAAALPRFAVNSVCPGWVRTDMGGPNAPRSVDQGADTIAWLADEAAQDLTGKFWRERAEIPW